MNQIQEIFDYIDEHFEEHVVKLQNFLRKRGVSLTEPLYTNEKVIESAQHLLDDIKALKAQEAELSQTDGYPVVYAKLYSKNPNAKTLILYSLYDLMPAEESDWKAPPFAAEILDAEEINLPRSYGKCIVSRGARNQRGPTTGFINALESILAISGDLPVNVIFAVEGEEELGSPHLSQFRDNYLEKLNGADAAFYPNPAQDEQGRHHIYLGAKGVVDVELEVSGGDWGGPAERSLFSADDAWIDSPVWRLIWALNTLKNPQGRILIEGFYDDVQPTSPEERQMLEKLRDTFDEESWKRERGIKKFMWDLPGKDLFVDYIMNPIINIDGIIGGYTGPGIKTNFPQSATVKIDIRLVPNMDMDDILLKLRKHLNKHGFPEVQIHKGAGFIDWARTPITSDIAQAAIRATEKHRVEVLCWPQYWASYPAAVFTEPPLNLPCVSAGLGHMGRPHEANEFITVNGLRIFEKYVVTFLYEYAGLLHQ